MIQSGMVSVRVDVLPLFPALRSELIALLEGLSPRAWQAPTACPGWSVHGVASHLLGVEVGNVSVRRDGWRLSPGPGEDPDRWLGGFNQQWVDASKRLSPVILIDMLALASQRFIEHVATLDLEAEVGAVTWATGTRSAPVWLDVAREYMERFVHQYQIREATGRPALGRDFIAPVLTAAAHALPRALDSIERPIGTSVRFVAEGEGGGAWSVVQTENGWELTIGPVSSPACELTTTVGDALKLYVRDPSGAPPDRRGDPELAEALSGVKAILG